MLVKEAFKFDPNSTENQGRWRLKDPKEFDKMWTEKEPDETGITYIVGTLKTGGKAIQAVRFSKKHWTEAEAGRWWNKHKSKSKYKKTWTDKDWTKWKKKKRSIQLFDLLIKTAKSETWDPAEHDMDEVLIDKDGIKKTRGQIIDYYKKNAAKLFPYVKDKDVVVLLGVGENKTILKRNIDGGKRIHITKKDGADDQGSLEYWYLRRAIEFHPTLGTTTNQIWVDLDPHSDKVRPEAKKIAAKVSLVMKKLYPGAKTKVWDSGKRGFHVVGELSKEVDTDDARQKLKEALDEAFKDSDVATTGIAKDDQIRLDTTTLKNTGSIRAPYSFSVYGRPKIPVGESNDASDKPRHSRHPTRTGDEEVLKERPSVESLGEELDIRVKDRVQMAFEKFIERAKPFLDEWGAEEWEDELESVARLFGLTLPQYEKLDRMLGEWLDKQLNLADDVKTADAKSPDKAKEINADDEGDSSFSPIAFMRLKKIESPEKLLDKYNPSDLVVEKKIDGFKVMAVRNSEVKLYTRRGKDVSKNAPSITKALEKLPPGTAILGEMTVIKNGKQSISDIQTVLGSSPENVPEIEGKLVYYVYDILTKGKTNLTKKPWQERDKILRSTLKNDSGVELVKNYSFDEREKAMEEALAEGGEGIVIKLKSAPYEYRAKSETEPQGLQWKFKPGAKAQTTDVVLKDYEKGADKLKFPMYQKKGDEWVSIGTISGMNKAEEAEIKKAIDAGEEIVAEISFQDWTADNKLRHAGWVRQRPDRNPKTITFKN